ncbi:tRNA pseudouridine(55) synthase TruB [Lactobacillus sp.]|uniref:tRNA pseudouridine(55) synthase TruB n=1 Tax=Lactobacillus sp. TaxID=1591 RepID=UPI001996D69B|nr:tRNA pseudouridine(55) synthase TruB [Lactobacillus sp.]MBD5429031.1 tRNA pseudouridine(55) synthase TruB [Lactobacillus sp.]MBD5429262.1 tRNA pseudouridine(55) synthase TruB [Lactobacillus sp.]
MLNGIVVLNKPRGMTSSDCVYKLRKILHIKKIGHAGTLDPEVNGVLPIAIGQATKLIELMHTKPKSYVGQGMFGQATDSYDLEGKVLEKKEILDPISSKEIVEGMNKLTGKIEQVPPIYSAVKVNGKRLYEYAREGISVERPKREVEIYSYRLTSDPIYDGENKSEKFNFSIQCSKGTYVRSLVNDLGSLLGVPAVMTKLTRTASSGYDMSQAVSLEEIEANINEPDKWLQSIDSFFVDLTNIDLTESQFSRVKNGAGIRLTNVPNTVALSYKGKIKAIYKKKDREYRPDLMLLQNN